MPASARRWTQESSRGRPAIGTRHLGIASVKGRSRVPSPPARSSAVTAPARSDLVLVSTSMSMPINQLIVDEDVPAAVASDPERQLVGPPQGLADGPMPPRRRDQEQ